MIVMFGATADVGRHAARLLLDRGQTMRLVGRTTHTLDHRAERCVGDRGDARKFSRGAKTVISCMHPRTTRTLLAGLDDGVEQVVLMSSTWRYSKVSNEGAESARDGERAFLASRFDGTLLHATMIYGGAKDRNVARLRAYTRRMPIMPMPGGGRHLVQPVHFRDVGACIAEAAMRRNGGKKIFNVAGPVAFTWCEMAERCAAAEGRRLVVVNLPLGPMIALISAAEWLGLRLPATGEMLARFRESTSFDIGDMLELGVRPRPFLADAAWPDLAARLVAAAARLSVAGGRRH